MSKQFTGTWAPEDYIQGSSDKGKILAEAKQMQQEVVQRCGGIDRMSDHSKGIYNGLEYIISYIKICKPEYIPIRQCPSETKLLPDKMQECGKMDPA